MNDTDIYADAYRAPDPPPTGPENTRSKYATTGGIVPETPIHKRGKHP